MSQMDRLLQWAISEGAKLSKIAPSLTNDREFVASDNISGGEEVISLPQHLLLHAGIAKESSDYGHAFGNLLGEQLACMDQRNALCVLLILERARGESSKWAAYINILPHEYDDPYWWSSEELGVVKGTRLGRAIEHYRPGLGLILSWTKRLEELYRCASGSSGILSSYQNGWALTLDAARWARSTVWSRAFTIHRLNGQPGSGSVGEKQDVDSRSRPSFLRPGSPVIALVPVLDMIDHDPSVEAVWHTGPDGIEDFQFCPLSAFSKGSVMRNNYGFKTNDELILAYGFALKDNAADHCLISLALGSKADEGGPDWISGASGLLDVNVGPGSEGAAVSMMADTYSRGDEIDVAQHPQHHHLQNGKDTGAPQLPKHSDQVEDGNEEDAMQLQVELLQRDVAFTALGLAREHRLTLEAPLPKALVLSARLCLLPPGDLYSVMARLNRRLSPSSPSKAPETTREDEEMDEDMRCGHDPAGSSGMKRVQPEQDGERREGQSDRASLTNGSFGFPGSPSLNLPDSAMHIVPRKRFKGPLDPQSLPGAAFGNSPASSALSDLLNGSNYYKSNPVELPALVLLRKQILDRLQKLVPEKEARRLLRIPTYSGHQSPTSKLHEAPLGTSLLAGLSKEVDKAKLPHRASLALLYVEGQRRILTAALRELEGKISSCLVSLHGLALPTTALGSDVHARAFDVVPSLSDVHDSLPVAFCTAATPTPSMIFGLSNARHMAIYMAWIEKVLGPLGVAHGAAHRPLALKEVLCLPKTECLAAANKNGPSSPSSVKRSGSKNRRPIGSVTLRSLRGHTSGTGPISAHIAAVAASTSTALETPTLPAGISAALGLDIAASHDPVSWGAMTTCDLQSGDLITEIPEEYALISASRNELLGALLVPAHKLLQELVAHAASLSASTDPVVQQLSLHHRPLTKLTPREMLVLHLMHTTGAPPAARLPSAESDQVSMLLEMLEDSPAGSAYQEAFGAFKSDFQEFRASVSISSQPSSSTGDGKLSLFSEGSSKALTLAKQLDKVMAWPGAFGLFCWANGVIERCAIKGTAQDGFFWSVMPLASAVPPQLREAALHVELTSGSSGNRQQPWSPSGSVGSGRRLRILASCFLPSGLLLGPALMVVKGLSTVEGLMEAMGPEALAWRKLLTWQSKLDTLHASSAPQLTTASGPQCAPATANNDCPTQVRSRFSQAAAVAPTSAPEFNAIKLSAPTEPSLLENTAEMQYELFISPSEEDPLHKKKLDVLNASGLGTVHYLTGTLASETKALVLSSLKICLADEELLSHPLVLKVAHLHEKLEGSRSTRQLDHPPGCGSNDPPGLNVLSDAAPMPSLTNAAVSLLEGEPKDLVSDSMVEGQNGQALNAVSPTMKAFAPHENPIPESIVQAMHSAQQELVEMLESLPYNHETASAAGKQLRQIITDARKHARRRLRQIDTQQEMLAPPISSKPVSDQDGSAGSPEAIASSRPQAAPPTVLSGGIEVLRQGVHNYLEELVAVLDRWAESLGLESRLENSVKNPKRKLV